MSAILFSRFIGPVPVDVIMRELHRSSLGITENPIETGARVSDHAYVDPKRLVLEFASGYAAATYNALVRFQETRVPFTIVSGLFVYQNMLIKELSANRDAYSSRILDGRAELQEVIIVSTAYTASEGEDIGTPSPGRSGGTKSTQSARPIPERAGDAITQDRASGTIMRGDSAEQSVSPSSFSSANTSILQGLL